jgi:hypothetical protein
MGSSDGPAGSAASPSPASSTSVTSNSATREVSYSKPANKPADKTDSKGTGGPGGKDC